MRTHSTHVRTHTNNVRMHVRTDVRMHTTTHNTQQCTCVRIRTHAYAPGTSRLSRRGKVNSFSNFDKFFSAPSLKLFSILNCVLTFLKNKTQPHYANRTPDFGSSLHKKKIGFQVKKKKRCCLVIGQPHGVR